MAYIFGDSMDLYAAVADALAGYWDGSTNSTGITLVAGRFTGSQALQLTSATSGAWFKNSGANDAVHHVVCAVRQTAALSGTTLGAYISLSDGATAQCSIVFRSDGAILLTSGGPAGTALDTYTGAVTLQNQWFAFEFEVVINNTTGSWAVRKNGNTSNDHALGSLNTRGGTANNYASRMVLGMQAAVSAQQIDDLLWRSDAASVPWVGDVRCYTRMPASDASVQFSRLSPVTQSAPTGGAINLTGGRAFYSPYVASVDGTIGSVTMVMNAAYTGNIKCSLFASSAGNPGAVLASATAVATNPSGTFTYTFSPAVSITDGTTYFVGLCPDTTQVSAWSGAGSTCFFGNVTGGYAAFPVASPTSLTGGNPLVAGSIVITPTDNNSLVNETLQDGAATYVYDSNVGDADFYGIAAIGVTPASVVAVTTRGFMQKSDAGSRSGAVQIKSGSTTVQSTPAALSTTFAWMWRTDTTDPATSAAWTPTAVNNVTIGPTCTA